MPEILFHGAAGEVTGSMHMIRCDDQWVALDCGMFQGARAESDEKNRAWPVPPNEIAAVVVSHAHIDHTGRLPKLVKGGFDGPIFCTAATRDLAAIMLADSAHIQVEDAFYVNKKRARKGLDPIQPLYEPQDALAATKLMQSIPYDRWFPVVPGMLARYVEAGHMLGSAGVHVEFAKRNGHTHTLYFSGDVGREKTPILRDPQPFPAADTVVCESTYGGKLHETVGDARERLRDTIARTYKRGGKVVIPAFSVGRTQTIVYYMNQLMVAGELPRYPVYVDSPLAVNATEVFRMHPECYDADATTFQQRIGDILGGCCATYIREVEDSKRLHERKEPCTILAASGMCEAGRVRHHLKNNIEDPRNTILFCGFQAENTLGRTIADGAAKVRLFQEEYQVRAEVVRIEGFSGHADQAELLKELEPHMREARQVFLVHGELSQSNALAAKLREKGVARIEIAKPGKREEL